MTTPICAHNDDMIESAALGLLSPAEAQALNQRLAACPACRQRLKEYRALAAAMPDLMRSHAAVSPARAADNVPLWFQFGTGSPTTTPILDPTHAGSATFGATTWASDAGYVFIPGPGCYRLSASWPGGGGWSVSFLAM